MDDRLQRKLKRMGVTRGLKVVKSPPSSAPERAFKPAPPATLPGVEIQTNHGPVWVDRHTYTATHKHGAYTLGELSSISGEAVTLLGTPGLGARPAFLDTETTGLAGGSGTLAFLTGIGVWQDEAFTLHLVFMRDPGEELAAMHYIADILRKATGLVTFNGRGFDVPLLETRFILNRLSPQWTQLPHLDLLTVARQLWRDHLPSRRLGELENKILGVARTSEDVPSWMIPDLYVQYLKTGETAEMARIFYHNLVDVLSLASLLVHTAQMVISPERMQLAAAEWVGVGRVYDRAEREAAAFIAWERALCGDEGLLEPACAVRLWREMGVRHKRCEAWERAFALWDAWAERLSLDVEPLVERAKYYEWTLKDVEAALAETGAALARAAQHPRGLERDLILGELYHRQGRLKRKIANGE